MWMKFSPPASEEFIRSGVSGSPLQIRYVILWGLLTAGGAVRRYRSATAFCGVTHSGVSGSPLQIRCMLVQRTAGRRCQRYLLTVKRFAAAIV